MAKVDQTEINKSILDVLGSIAIRLDAVEKAKPIKVTKIPSANKETLDPSKYQGHPMTYRKGFINFGPKMGVAAFTLLAMKDQGRLESFLEEHRAEIISDRQEFVSSLKK